MNAITLHRTDITDPVLARAALCGDITGRGAMLGDNDVRALDALLDTLVPSSLADLGFDCEPTPDGWSVTAPHTVTTTTASTLTGYLIDRLLTALNPAVFEPSAITGPVPRLRPDW